MFPDLNSVGYNSEGYIYVNVGMAQLILNESEFLDFSNYLDSIYNDKNQVNGGFKNVTLKWKNVHSEVNHGFIEIYNNVNLFKEQNLNSLVS